jgi:hypothetical protein
MGGLSAETRECESRFDIILSLCKVDGFIATKKKIAERNPRGSSDCERCVILKNALAEGSPRILEGRGARGEGSRESERGWRRSRP